MNMLTIRKVRSSISCLPKHRKTLEALGLKKIRQEHILPDNETVRGMIERVKYMVEVIKE